MGIQHKTERKRIVFPSLRPLLNTFCIPERKKKDLTIQCLPAIRKSGTWVIFALLCLKITNLIEMPDIRLVFLLIVYGVPAHYDFRYLSPTFLKGIGLNAAI